MGLDRWEEGRERVFGNLKTGDPVEIFIKKKSK